MRDDRDLDVRVLGLGLVICTGLIAEQSLLGIELGCALLCCIRQNPEQTYRCGFGTDRICLLRICGVACLLAPCLSVYLSACQLVSAEHHVIDPEQIRIKKLRCSIHLPTSWEDSTGTTIAILLCLRYSVQLLLPLLLALSLFPVFCSRSRSRTRHHFP